MVLNTFGNRSLKTVVNPEVSRASATEASYRCAERKAQLWSSIGQLKEAARNGIIRRELVAELSNVRRTEYR